MTTTRIFEVSLSYNNDLANKFYNIDQYQDATTVLDKTYLEIARLQTDIVELTEEEDDDAEKKNLTEAKLVGQKNLLDKVEPRLYSREDTKGGFIITARHPETYDRIASFHFRSGYIAKTVYTTKENDDTQKCTVRYVKVSEGETPRAYLLSHVESFNPEDSLVRLRERELWLLEKYATNLCIKAILSGTEIAELLHEQQLELKRLAGRSKAKLGFHNVVTNLFRSLGNKTRELDIDLETTKV